MVYVKIFGGYFDGGLIILIQILPLLLLLILIPILIPIQIRMQNMDLEMLIYVVLSKNFDGCFGGALIIMIIIQNLVFAGGYCGLLCI